MFRTKLFLCSSLHVATLSALQLQAQCPGNIHSLHATFVQRSQIIVPVSINGAGPFDFLVDTGDLITMVDPALASELGLKPQASIGVVAVTQMQHSSIEVVDSISVDSHTIQKPLVITHDISQIQATSPRVRGILGQNFLAHFDMLIDYSHKLLCLDETGQLQQSLRGQHIPLVEPQNRETDFPFAQPLLIHVRLGSSAREKLLRLDSGANMPLLYDGDQETPAWLQKKPTVTSQVVGKSDQAFSLMSPQDIHVGSDSFNQVSFIAPLIKGRGRSNSEEDGLLPTSLLRRIFISYVDHFVLLSPK